MLTGATKIGYLLTYSGLAALLLPLLMVLLGRIDSFYITLLAVCILPLAIGLILLRQDETSRSLGWRVLRAQALRTRMDRAAFSLIIFGSFLIPIRLIISWSDGSLESPLSDISIPLLILAIGWLLALSEFLPSRSAQK